MKTIFKSNPLYVFAERKKTPNTKNILNDVRKQCSVVDVPMCWWLYRAGEGRDGGEGCCRAQSVAALKTDF